MTSDKNDKFPYKNDFYSKNYIICWNLYQKPQKDI